MSHFQSSSQVHPTYPSISDVLSFNAVNHDDTYLGGTPMQAFPRKRAKKAPTLNAEAWIPHKDRILQLHVEEGHSLKQVAQIMEEESGFKATERQYQTRISQWKRDKNVKPEEMQAIVRKSQHRELTEKSKPPLHFEVRGKVVTDEQISRWMKRNNAHDDELYNQDTEMTTPSAIVCRTVSSRGTSILSPRSAASIEPSSPGILPETFSYTRLHFGTPPHLETVGSPISSFAGYSPAVVDFSSPWPNIEIDTEPHEKVLDPAEWLSSGFDKFAKDIPTGGQNPLAYVESTYNDARFLAVEERNLLAKLKQHESDGRQSSWEYSKGMLDLVYFLYRQARYNTATSVLKHIVVLSQRNPAYQVRIIKMVKYVTGCIFYAEGRYERAEVAFTEVLELDANDLRGSEPDYRLKAMASLGKMYALQGQHEKAELILLQVLRDDYAIGNSNYSHHLEVMSFAIGTLVAMYTSYHRFEEAEEIAKPILKMARDVTISFSEDMIFVIDYISLMYELQGRRAEAQELLEKMVTDLLDAFGTGNYSTWDGMLRLGVFHHHVGNLSNATNILRSVVEGYSNICGGQHPETSSVMTQLAVVLRKRDQWEEANRLGEKAVRDLSKVLGLRHFRTFEATANLGHIYQSQGRSDQAYPLLQAAIEALQDVPYRDRLCLHRAIRSLLEICHERQEWDEIQRLRTIEAGLSAKRRILNECTNGT